MTASAFVSELIKADLALSAGVMAVLALRVPARRWLGARAAYGLWLIPLIASVAVLVPGRSVIVPAPAPVSVSQVVPAEVLPDAPAAPTILPALAPRRPLPTAQIAAALWALGALACLGWFARNQRRFLRLAKAGQAGPAAVGVLRPRIVTPSDFKVQFTRPERAAVIAHEAAHIAAQHPRLNALAALVQAVHWFNPLIHLAAQAMRVDQELACDAAVVAARPRLRRAYAEALLKSQLASTPLPLGCYWPPKSEHPLTRRVEMLGRPIAGPGLRLAAICGVGAVTLAAGVAAWAAQPVREVQSAAVTISTSQWWQDSDDPAAHTPAGQAAYTAALQQARDLEPDLAGQFAKYTRWAVEQEHEPPLLITYILLDRSRAEWPKPVKDDNPSQLSLAGSLILKDGRQIKVDLPRASYGMTTQSIDDREGRSEIVQPQRTPNGADLRIGFGLADGRILLSPVISVRPDQTQTVVLNGGERLTLTARFTGPPPPVRRVKEVNLLDPPDGLQTISDQTQVLKDGRITVLTGHVQLRDGEQVTLADKATIRLSEKVYQQGRKASLERYNQVAAATETARRDYAAGKISRIDLDRQERNLRQARQDLRLTQPSAAPEAPAPSAQPSILITTDAFTRSSDGSLVPPNGPKTVEIGAIDPVTGQTRFQHDPSLVVPKAYTLTPDPDLSVHLSGLIERIEWTNPRAIVHLRDEKTGKLWAVETGTTNTLRRGGIDEAHATGRIDIRAMGAKDDRCQPECRALMREMTFVDGRKVFLGSPGTASRAVPPDEKRAALAAGDWRKAAKLGATAADIVRVLQSRGQNRDINPDEAVVVLPADGGPPQVTAMKPLPALPGEQAPVAPLGGTGFNFANPGAIILYPPGAMALGPGGSGNHNMLQPPVLRQLPQPNPYAEVRSMREPPILRREGPGSETGQAMLTPVTDAGATPGRNRPPPGWRAFAAVYDGSAPVRLKGVITGLEWTNPRVLVHMVDAASGQAWTIEGASPEVVTANGLSRQMLAKGTQIEVRGYQAKNKECRPECLANARDLTFTDGRKLFMGSSGTGAPSRPSN